MHKLNPRTAALLSAFGWAVGYLLAGKALAVLLPVPPGGAARFFRVCLLAPLVEEGVFRGGLGLGWLADRTGHLWPGMLLHSANNLLVLAMG